MRIKEQETCLTLQEHDDDDDGDDDDENTAHNISSGGATVCSITGTQIVGCRCRLQLKCDGTR